MKTALSFALLPLVLCAGAAEAGRDRHHDHGDYARVVSVRPIVETVSYSRPQRECWEETVGYRTRHDSATPLIVGGIVGGVVGNRFGEGKGKDAMTVAGALLGASLGRDAYADQGGSHPVTEERCHTRHTVHEHERIAGYHVSYRYHGRLYTTRMPYDPGDRIRVRVHVDPEE